MTKRIGNKLTYIIAVILAAVISFSLLTDGGAVNVSAVSASGYSNVLTDLMSDEQFDTSEYPVNNSDYSIKVIQIAESEDKELLVYIYQPCIAFSDMKATSINLAFTDTAKSWKNYTLTQINRGGALGKYKVDGVTVGDSNERVYDISSVFRNFNRVIDSKSDGNQTISEVAYPVGQMWTATTVSDGVTYEVEDVEILEISEQFVGFRRYGEGLKWGGIKSCDAHYFAFSTEHNIDYLLEADVEYDTQHYKQLAGQDLKFDGAKEHNFVTVHYYDEGASNKKRWSRLSSMDEFLSNDTLKFTDEDIERFSQYDWIINFCETEYQNDFSGKDILAIATIFIVPVVGAVKAIIDACTTEGTLVTDVTLLRLEFMSENTVYNLGVVSNKQSGGSIPSNQPAINKQKKRAGIIAGLVIGGIVVIALLVLSVIFPKLGEVIVAIFKGLWWLICLPFRGIAALIGFIKARNAERKKNSSAKTARKTAAKKPAAKKKQKKSNGKK